MTTGSPPSITATQELVVPRLFLIGSGTERHRHQRGPKQASAQGEASLKLIDDGADRLVGRDLLHRFVHVGIEGLALGGERSHAVPLELIDELLVDELHTFDDRLGLWIIARRTRR
jgi:hypothetical protein